MNGFILSGQPRRQDDKLDLMPDVVKRAGYAIWSTTGVEPRMIVTQLITAMSASASPHFTIKMFNRPAQPISVPTLNLGESGTGKSEVHTRIIPPFQHHADDSNSRHRQAVMEHRADLEIWQFRVRELKRSISKLKDDVAARSAMDQDLKELIRRRPAVPKERPRLVGKMDFEAMLGLLDGDNEAIDMISNEGDKWLKGGLLLRHASEMNDIHDGIDPPSIRIERKRPLDARTPHISIGLMARLASVKRFQPSFHNGVIEKSELVNLGYFARYFVTVTDEKPGSTWESENPMSTRDLANFHTLIRALLRLHRIRLATGSTKRIELTVATEASHWWEELCRHVRNLAQGELAHIDEYAGKMLSLTLRLAALIHVFESKAKVVTLSALQRAWKLIHWSASHYATAFSPTPPPPQADQDVVAVEKYLREEYQRIGDNVSVRFVATMMNMPARRVTAALVRLAMRGLLYINDDKAKTISLSLNFVSMGFRGRPRNM